jgi:hypothetical protein
MSIILIPFCLDVFFCLCRACLSLSKSIFFYLSVGSLSINFNHFFSLFNEICGQKGHCPKGVLKLNRSSLVSIWKVLGLSLNTNIHCNNKKGSNWKNCVDSPAKTGFIYSSEINENARQVLFYLPILGINHKLSCYLCE